MDVCVCKWTRTQVTFPSGKLQRRLAAARPVSSTLCLGVTAPKTTVTSHLLPPKQEHDYSSHWLFLLLGTTIDYPTLSCCPCPIKMCILRQASVASFGFQDLIYVVQLVQRPTCLCKTSPQPELNSALLNRHLILLGKWFKFLSHGHEATLQKIVFLHFLYRVWASNRADCWVNFTLFCTYVI